VNFAGYPPDFAEPELLGIRDGGHTIDDVLIGYAGDAKVLPTPMELRGKKRVGSMSVSRT
jgi:hypothetical protein